MSTTNARSLTDLLAPYLSELPARQIPAAGCVAVAGPILGDWCQMTNAPLSFSIEQTRRDLDLEELIVVNDFAATARCLPHLGRAEYQLIGTAEVRADGVRVVLGPGTGLGLAAVVPIGRGWKVIAGEGGHVALSALHDDEIELVKLLRQQYGFASAEMALSGPGLRRTYIAMAERAGTNCARPPSAAQIVRRACDGEDEISAATLGMFCRLLAATAANAAMTFGALGGVYIAGGIVRRFPEFVHSSGFRERFETHPHAGSYLSSIATALITVEQPGLFGAYRLLRDHASSAVPTP